MAVSVPLEWELRFRRRLRRERVVRVVAPTLSAAIAVARQEHDLEKWRFDGSRTISGGEPATNHLRDLGGGR